MSKVTLEIIQGLAQAAANSYDGALDDKGEPIKIGLRREVDNPMVQSRMMDGFKVRIAADKCIISYQSDIKLKEVYGNNFKNEMEDVMSKVASHLKKEYKKITGKTLSLTPQEECDILVQSTSRVRVFVTCNKVYKLGGLEEIADNERPSEERFEGAFKKFVELGGWGKKSPNKNQKGG
tara:strand:+ start:1971 stop:2507 length:537 start_codon:yes stop_codon:yes gene_type:complete